MENEELMPVGLDTAHVGRPAPAFRVEAVVEKDKFTTISLEDYKGKWLVVFFYPLDFTFVCPTEIKEFREYYEEFKKLNAEVIGGSTDSVYSHKAWIEQELGELPFPLFADKNMIMSMDYEVLQEEEGVALRGTFIIDPEGILRYALYHDMSVGRSTKETLRVLEALQTGENCPASWTKGQETLGK